jgi:hypothetical protein
MAAGWIAGRRRAQTAVGLRPVVSFPSNNATAQLKARLTKEIEPERVEIHCLAELSLAGHKRTIFNPTPGQFNIAPREEMRLTNPAAFQSGIAQLRYQLALYLSDNNDQRSAQHHGCHTRPHCLR